MDFYVPQNVFGQYGKIKVDLNRLQRDIMFNVMMGPCCTNKEFKVQVSRRGGLTSALCFSVLRDIYSRKPLYNNYNIIVPSVIDMKRVVDTLETNIIIQENRENSFTWIHASKYGHFLFNGGKSISVCPAWKLHEEIFHGRYDYPYRVEKDLFLFDENSYDFMDCVCRNTLENTYKVTVLKHGIDHH